METHPEWEYPILTGQLSCMPHRPQRIAVVFMRGACESDAVPLVRGNSVYAKDENPQDFLRSSAVLIGECDPLERAQQTDPIERSGMPHGQNMHADCSDTQPPPISQSTTLRDAPAAHQVDDQYDKRNHQQQVNQSACDVKAETKKPQNQKHHEKCPKHIDLLRSLKRPENLSISRRHAERATCRTRSKILATTSHLRHADDDMPGHIMLCKFAHSRSKTDNTGCEVRSS